MGRERRTVRRALCCVVILGWPAVAAFRLTTHPRWEASLSIAGALVSAVCGAVLWAWRHRETAARAREAEAMAREAVLRATESVARKVDDLDERMAGLSGAITQAFLFTEAPRPERRLRAVPRQQRQDGLRDTVPLEQAV